MKILFLGTLLNPLSIACLKALCDAHRYTVVVGIASPWRGGALKAFLRRWRRYGRHDLLKRIRLLLVSTLQNQVKTNGSADGKRYSLLTMAILNNVEHFWCDNINGEDSLRTIRAFSPDLIVVANFSQVLRAQLLEIPSMGCVNVHPSLLPKYRGPSPIYWVLKNKESVTGVTIHYIDERIDSGDIILQKQIPIDGRDNERTLESKCALVGSEILQSAIDLVKEGKAKRRKQEEDDATYYSFPRSSHQ